MTRRCSRCSETVGPDDPAALGWSLERRPDGSDAALCPACARAHVRDIEARIAPEWW
ncbi:MAG: hypothetical protein OJJ54_23440 [Pseudonocardia sp.]|nr:hypothetical protein [Pseudonocardia sp.]